MFGKFIKKNKKLLGRYCRLISFIAIVYILYKLFINKKLEGFVGNSNKKTSTYSPCMKYPKTPDNPKQSVKDITKGIKLMIMHINDIVLEDLEKDEELQERMKAEEYTEAEVNEKKRRFQEILQTKLKNYFQKSLTECPTVKFKGEEIDIDRLGTYFKDSERYNKFERRTLERGSVAMEVANEYLENNKPPNFDRIQESIQNNIQKLLDASTKYNNRDDKGILSQDKNSLLWSTMNENPNIAIVIAMHYYNYLLYSGDDEKWKMRFGMAYRQAILSANEILELIVNSELFKVYYFGNIEGTPELNTQETQKHGLIK